MGWQFTLPDIFKSMAREGFMPSAFAYRCAGKGHADTDIDSDRYGIYGHQPES